ncbi:AaceriAER247Wp [[Ashbya] aceris (nom. inval.)]|nr:AaceriAER247Wp [[Ashbya] aceris (nom. inval.)]
MSAIKTALLLLLYLVQATSLHFYLRPGETKCFYEGITKESQFFATIDAHVEDEDGKFSRNPHLTVSLFVYASFDANELVFAQRNSPFSEFQFTALESGEHRICMTPNFPHTTAQLRIFVDFKVSTSDMLDSRRLMDVTYLQDRIDYLVSRLEDIRSDQEVLRKQDEEAQRLSKVANQQMILWSAVQSAALVLVFLFQLRHLKNFFNRKVV